MRAMLASNADLDDVSPRQLRLSVGGVPLRHFKPKGEPLRETLLKAAVWGRLSEGGLTPEIDPPAGSGRHRPHVAVVDPTGRTSVWAHVGPWKIEDLTHVLKHAHADRVIWALEQPPEADLDALVERTRKAAHYRYTNKKLELWAYAPLETWPDLSALDPDEALEIRCF